MLRSRCAVALCDPVRPVRQFRAVESRHRTPPLHRSRVESPARARSPGCSHAAGSDDAQVEPERSLPAWALRARAPIWRTSGRARVRTPARSGISARAPGDRAGRRTGTARGCCRTAADRADTRRRCATRYSRWPAVPRRRGMRARCAADPPHSRGTDQCHQRQRRHTTRNSQEREPAPARAESCRPNVEASVDRNARRTAYRQCAAPGRGQAHE